MVRSHPRSPTFSTGWYPILMSSVRSVTGAVTVPVLVPFLGGLPALDAKVRNPTRLLCGAAVGRRDAGSHGRDRPCGADQRSVRPSPDLPGTAPDLGHFWPWLG